MLLTSCALTLPVDKACCARLNCSENWPQSTTWTVTHTIDVQPICREAAWVPTKIAPYERLNRLFISKCFSSCGPLPGAQNDSRHQGCLISKSIPKPGYNPLLTPCGHFGHDSQNQARVMYTDEAQCFRETKPKLDLLLILWKIQWQDYQNPFVPPVWICFFHLVLIEINSKLVDFWYKPVCISQLTSCTSHIEKVVPCFVFFLMFFSTLKTYNIVILHF